MAWSLSTERRVEFDQEKACEFCGATMTCAPQARPSNFVKKRFCDNRCSRNFRAATEKRERWDAAVVGMVPLGKGRFAQVDADDWDRVRDHVWRLSYRRDKGAYVVNEKMEYLHRFILPGFPEIDHKDNDRLNCKKENLRPASRSDNSANTKIRSTNTSGYKGVTWHKGNGSWMASIKSRTIGYFSSKIEAAVAYDDMARKEFGEFARLNFPALGEESAR